MMRPKVSVVVVTYNMARELPRTIQSLSPSMQRNIAADDYEVIVVDNGSRSLVDIDACRQWGANIVFHRMEPASVSPCAALNRGLQLAQGEIVGAMVDGARMASPGLLWTTMAARRLHDRPIISTLGFHLGPKVQMQSVREGYDQGIEDRLLDGAGWQADGYRLFDISVLAGSSAAGWFSPIAESNALFLPRSVWQELGGCDEQFVSAGGGLANLDLYRRACGLTNSQLVVLLGEGTFHQVHGGIATNALTSPWPAFHAEYVRLRQQPFAAPTAPAWLFGLPTRHCLPFIAASAHQALAKDGDGTTVGA